MSTAADIGLWSPARRVPWPRCGLDTTSLQGPTYRGLDNIYANLSSGRGCLFEPHESRVVAEIEALNTSGQAGSARLSLKSNFLAGIIKRASCRRT